MYVIGTAGHVDHGKSALVQALTGIDPDRLREEKERGLTIDLGFAWLQLPGGQEISIVDVPGHERFIKNMLAGVGGIDLALLIIAADESVMPQTREHLAIIDLLNISHGVIAVTKADLVEPDFLELVKAEAEEVLEGTALAGAPIIPCSAVTRQGLDELLAAIEAELARTPAKRDIGRPRLPIDRAFTITGFGTVATGTLIDGDLRVGQEVELLPGGLRTRVRGLQTHTQKVDVAPPGRRTAVNLTGLAVEKLRRGMVATTPGWLEPTTALDVRLRAVRYLGRPIRHNLSVTVHTGSAEVPGRVLLLDSDSLPPGEQAWAQLRLSEPVATVKGDRFILRDPNDTLAGGRILDTHVRRHRRFHQPTLDALETLASGSPEELVGIALAAAEPAERRELLRRVELDRDATLKAIDSLIAAGEILALDPTAPLADHSLLCTAQGFQALANRLQDILATYHRQAPLRRGIPREELRSRLRLESRPFDQTLALCARRGEAIDTTGTVALPNHQPRPNPEQENQAQACLASLKAQPFAPPTDNLPEEPLLAYLEDRGEIVRLGGGIAFAAETYSQIVERIVSHLRQQRTITLAQVRDMFGTSRKYAQALLEHMDDQRITRRRGDERVLYQG